MCHNITTLLENLTSSLSVDAMALERACIDGGSTRLIAKDLLTINTTVVQCMRAAADDKASGRDNGGDDDDGDHGDGDDHDVVRDRGLTNAVDGVEDSSSSNNSSSSNSSGSGSSSSRDGTRKCLFESLRKRAQSIESEVR